MALHSAFDSLLEEKRFEELTVNELCERAMIRRTTFYKHFADKYEYYAFYIKEVVATFQERLSPDVGEYEINGYLLHMSRELIRFVKEHDKLVQNIKKSSMFPILLNIMLEQMSLDVRRVMYLGNNCSLGQEQIDAIAAFYASGLTNTLFQYLKKDIPVDENCFVETVDRFLIPLTL